MALILMVSACMLSHFSHVQLCVTPRTVAHQVSPDHGILQARMLMWVAKPSSRRFSQPRDQTCISYISCIGRQVFLFFIYLFIFTTSAIWEAQS